MDTLFPICNIHHLRVTTAILFPESDAKLRQIFDT